MKRDLLYHFVQDSLRPYFEDFVIKDRSNPVIVHFNGMLHSLHISQVHDSGNRRSNDDEVRIQIPRKYIDKQRSRREGRMNVAFIGFFEGGRVFTAWDPMYIFTLQAKRMVSVYARQTQKERVEECSAAVRTFSARYMEENTSEIALTSDSLGFYLQNIQHFHRLRSDEDIQRIVRDSYSANFLSIEGETTSTSEKRMRFSYTRKAFPRDPQFKKKVLAAYGHACCVCKRQLGIVEAAHIIPHSVDNSPNTVDNGLALCIEHHALYDTALLLPGPDNLLIFNQDRAEYLRQEKQAKGLDAIESLHHTRFAKPASREYEPSNENLQRGLEIRMGSGS